MWIWTPIYLTHKKPRLLSQMSWCGCSNQCGFFSPWATQLGSISAFICFALKIVLTGAFCFSSSVVHIPLNKLTPPSCLTHLMGASLHANKNRNRRNSAARRETWQRVLWLLRYEYRLIIFYSPPNKTKEPHHLIPITVRSIIFKWLKYVINIEMLEHPLFYKRMFEILSLLSQIVDAW